MQTLIFNGSPREDGDTVFLINELKSRLTGAVTVVNTHRSSIAPCCDCRYCWKHPSCRIDDEMQAVYEQIKACDNIVIASPVYFSELTGMLLAVMSRLQAFYAAKRFLGVTPVTKKKRGALLLCGGGDGAPERAVATAKTLLRLMNAELTSTVCSLNTDVTPSRADEDTLGQIVKLAAALNESSGRDTDTI